MSLWNNAPLDASLNNFSLEYSFGELLEATNNFDVVNQLGKGTYGAVYRGIRRDGTDVAIKVLEMPDEAGFEEEVRVLSKFRHPNLVILMGFARRDSARYLIYEMLAGGDCYERLQKCTREGLPFTWRERVSAAFDACCGLSHLHHASPKVFHRDIKTANILLDRNGTAKMADFGLACLSHAMAHKVEKTAGTTGYACPLYAKRSVVTEGSEIYSFGIVMLELLTSICPAVLLQLPDGSQQYKFLVCEIKGSADIAIQKADTRANWPLEVAGGIANIALRCVEDAEELRPDFVVVVNKLRLLRDFSPNLPEGRRGTSTSIQEGGYARRPSDVPPPLMELKYGQPAMGQPALEVRRVSAPEYGQVPEMFGAPARPIAFGQRPVAQLGGDPFGQRPVGQVVHQAIPQMQPPQHPAAMIVPQQRHVAVDRRQVKRLWTLVCTYAPAESFESLPQDFLNITHWQEVGTSLATTLRVGRMFQEEFFNKVGEGFSSVVSREHFQIWAEECCMPGIAERDPQRGIPCSFYLTNFSGNGTLVNGENIEGKCGQVQLHQGDVIAIPRMIEDSEGKIVVTPLIQFTFDLSGSLLWDHVEAN